MIHGQLAEPKAVTVVVVDDSDLVRDAFRREIASDTTLQIIGETGSAEEAVQMVKQLQPDVVVLDVHLKDGDGLNVCRMLASAGVQSKVLMVSGHWEPAYIAALARFGVAGYLSKSVCLGELAPAIHKVSAGWTVISPELSSVASGLMRSADEPKQAFPPTNGALTNRERQVLSLKSVGLRNSEVASRLGMRTKTVETHVHTISLKRGLSLPR